MNATQILTRDEIQLVLADMRRRARTSVNSRLNLAVFRLSCCCGLRCKEICGLNLGDVATGGPRPAIRVRKEITKGQDGKRRTRLVPLWWDRGTLEDLAAWKQYRLETAGLSDPFVCRQAKGAAGCRFLPQEVAKRWQTAIRELGRDRARQLSIHSGRHSFCSHALAVGRSLVEVRDAAGHRNIATTSIYLHTIEGTHIPDLFAGEERDEN